MTVSIAMAPARSLSEAAAHEPPTRLEDVLHLLAHPLHRRCLRKPPFPAARQPVRPRAERDRSTTLLTSLCSFQSARSPHVPLVRRWGREDRCALAGVRGTASGGAVHRFPED